MTRDKTTILNTLKTNRATLRGFGVQSIALFGSCARGVATEVSDLDFLVEFKTKTFDNYMGLKEYLEQLFSCRVDLVLQNTLKPRIRERILREAVHAPGL